MKIDRHGQAKVLTQEEIQLLFSQGLKNNRDRASSHENRLQRIDCRMPHPILSRGFRSPLAANPETL